MKLELIEDVTVEELHFLEEFFQETVAMFGQSELYNLSMTNKEERIFRALKRKYNI